MEGHLISIIVPVYNVEKYLRRCLDSIINQSYKNLEIILVDDGSTDNSGRICDEYKSKDERIIVLHIDNAGQSEARNKGIDIASGQYIGFVDGDDIIHKDMYRLMLDALMHNNVDLCMCKFKKFNNNNYIEYVNKQINRKISIKKLDKNTHIVQNRYALEECLYSKRFSVSPCTKLYKKEIFNSLRFPKYTEMEDWGIIVDVMLKCDIIVMLYEELYYYYQRDNSTMHGEFKEKDLKLDGIFIRNLELVNEYYPEIYIQAKTNLTAHYFYVIDKIIKSCKIKEYKDDFYITIEKLKEDKEFILFRSKHRFIRKMLFIVMLLSVKLYSRIISSL